MTATYTALATVTLTSAGFPVFSNIPNTFRDLVLVCEFTAATSSTSYIFFNSSDSNVTSVRMGGTGSGSGFSDTYTKIFMSSGSQASGHSATAQIFDYAQTNKQKTVLTRCGHASVVTVASAGRWASTNAITSIHWGNDAGTPAGIGSRFSLYGIN